MMYDYVHQHLLSMAMFPFEFKFYTASMPAWEAMLSDCKNATKSIDIEQYIFVADVIGNRFIEVLKEKRKQGVEVRMLIDTAGSYDFYSSLIPEELRKLGIEVKFFNVISPWRIHALFSWFFRDHRKILIVDGKIGYTSGLGIGDHMTDWRDTTARTEGNIVTEMTDSFLDMWRLADSKNLFSRIKVIRKSRKRKDFVTNEPFFRRRYLYRSLVEALQSAKKNIYITTPYFIPDRRLSRVLRLAVRRGVDVKLLLPQKFDVPLIGSGVESVFETFLKAGVRIFRYQPVFMHAKTTIVDDDWTTFGSFNMDNLSFRFNHEANIISFDSACVSHVAAHFFEDMKHCKEVIHSEWKKRPVTAKIRELFVSTIRTFL